MSDEELVPLTLVPVEVFGVEHYGIMDAVSPWSDCNRSIGQVFRVDDISEQYRAADEIVHIYVSRSELGKLLNKRWGDEVG